MGAGEPGGYSSFLISLAPDPAAAGRAAWHINKGVWESFDTSDRQVFEAVASCEYARSLAEFNANNARALRKLRDEGIVKILKFDDSLLKAFAAVSRDVVAEIGSRNGNVEENLPKL
jgi:TRAP-type mannitol/chloroaromatic compound transport system substrate-binding protein